MYYKNYKIKYLSLKNELELDFIKNPISTINPKTRFEKVLVGITKAFEKILFKLLLLPHKVLHMLFLEK
jgi:hypothetical protein